jgi:hypothetical protein
VFSWYQKSGGPSAAVLSSDCSSKMYTMGTAVDVRHPEVNARGLPPPPAPTRVSTWRLLPPTESVCSLSAHAEYWTPCGALISHCCGVHSAV